MVRCPALLEYVVRTGSVKLHNPYVTVLAAAKPDQLGVYAL